MEVRNKSNWTVIKEFQENGVLVEVSMNDAPRPRYNLRIGRHAERGTVPFLQCFVEGQGKVRVKSIAETIKELILEAERFVQERAQEHEDAYLARKIGFESVEVQRDGRKRPSSGYKQHDRRPNRQRRQEE